MSDMDDWIDAMSEEAKQAKIQSELEKVLRRFAQEIRNLRMRIRALEQRMDKYAKEDIRNN